MTCSLTTQIRKPVRTRSMNTSSALPLSIDSTQRSIRVGLSGYVQTYSIQQ